MGEASLMKRPWATRLPRKGAWALSRRRSWYFFTKTWTWLKEVGAVSLLWAGPLPSDWRARTREERYNMQKPKPLAALAGDDQYYWQDDALKRSHPALFEAMAAMKYEDGEKKGPGMLIIKPRNGKLSATLKVDGSGLMLRYEAETHTAVYDGLEALLVCDLTPWENDPYAATVAPKKPKKK